MDQGRVTCPACSKAYRWKEALSGRKVQCKCGAVFRMPSAVGERADLVRPPSEPTTASVDQPASTVNDDARQAPLSEGYDLHDSHLDAPVPRSARETASSGGGASGGGRCPSCNQPVKPAAVICVNCGFNLKSGTQLKTAVGKPVTDAADETAASPAGAAAALPDRFSSISGRKGLDTEAVGQDTARQQKWQDLYLPLIILGVGVVLVLINAFGLMPMAAKIFAEAWYGGAISSASEVMAAYLANVGTRLIIQLPVMIAAIFLVAGLFGSNYGAIGTALLKLAALAVMVGAVDDTVNAVLMWLTEGLGIMGFDMIIRLAMVYGTFLVLGMWLLDMDPFEAGVMFIIVMILPAVAIFFLQATIASLFA